MSAGRPEKQSNSLLNILPEEIPLRGHGPLLDQVAWPPNPTQDPPRALRALSHIVDGGLCHRCGSCVGICPTGVLALDRDDYPRVRNLSACTDCDLCVKVCPGDEFNFYENYTQRFNRPPALDDTHGVFERAVIAHATDPDLRAIGTSGGLISALLVDLFKSGQIDGAMLVGSDQQILWKGQPSIGRSYADVLAAAKSKYAISPTNIMLEEVRRIPGRYVAVGLPCQIHGILKAKSLDSRINERIVLTIGLFCHAAIEHDAFRVIWDSLGEHGQQAQKFTSRIGKHPGAPHVTRKDGSLYPVYFGNKKGYRPSSMEMINILYRLYTPPRCLTCFDALSEFADISVGDPWLPPPDNNTDYYQGWSFALLRTKVGIEYYESALTSGAITDKVLTRKEALMCNSMMAHEKRARAFRVIETHKRQGKAIPKYFEYGHNFPSPHGMQLIQTEIHMLTHVFCFLPRLRDSVLRFFLAEGGYRLLWLNSLRRRFRVWRRDTLFKFRTKLFGRS